VAVVAAAAFASKNELNVSQEKVKMLAFLFGRITFDRIQISHFFCSIEPN